MKSALMLVLMNATKNYKGLKLHLVLKGEVSKYIFFKIMEIPNDHIKNPREPIVNFS